MSKNNYKVYVHINKINGKRYYGITKQEPKKRWDCGYGYKNNKHFSSSIQKYGWNEGFEHIVIAKGLTEEEAKWLEIELIREHDTTNPKYGYNISLGGEGGNCTEETRNKMSEARKKIWKNEEIRKKHSKYMTGENNPMYGKTPTEETKKKISEANKGKGGTKVYCVELEQYFETVREASEYVGCCRENISMVLGKSNRTAKGYHWVYAEDVDIENNKVS